MILDVNKLIHTRMFGKCWHKFQGQLNYDNQIFCEFCGLSKAEITKNGLLNPDYCGNISDAFKAIEELEAQGYHFRFCTKITQLFFGTLWILLAYLYRRSLIKEGLLEPKHTFFAELFYGASELSTIPKDLEQLPQKTTEFLKPIIKTSTENKKLDETLRQIMTEKGITREEQNKALEIKPPQTDSKIEIVFRNNSEFVVSKTIGFEPYKLLRVFVDNDSYEEVIDGIRVKLDKVEAKNIGKISFSYTTNLEHDTKIKELTWKHSKRNDFTNVAMQSIRDKQEVILCLPSNDKEKMFDILGLEFDIVVTQNGKVKHSQRFALYLEDNKQLQLKEVQG